MSLTVLNEKNTGIKLYESNQWNDSESIQLYYREESNESAIGIRICLNNRYYYATVNENEENEFTAVRVIRDLRLLMRKYRLYTDKPRGDIWSKIKIAYLQVNSKLPELFCISPERIKGKVKDEFITFSVSKLFLLGENHSPELCKEIEGILMSEARSHLILKPNRVCLNDFDRGVIYSFITDKDLKDFIFSDHEIEKLFQFK